MEGIIKDVMIRQLDLTVTLIPAPGDPPLEDPDYQYSLVELFGELASRGVHFFAEFREGNVRVGPGTRLISSSPGVVTFLGQFLLQLAPTLAPLVGTVLGAWLHAKYGRKVRVKSGEVEAEAQTIQELRKLLRDIERFQERSRSKQKP